MIRALTTAILRWAQKSSPGVYYFNERNYLTKSELRAAIQDFCAGLTYDQVLRVQKNFNLI